MRPSVEIHDGRQDLTGVTRNGVMGSKETKVAIRQMSIVALKFIPPLFFLFYFIKGLGL